jgi:hypothetical protein
MPTWDKSGRFRREYDQLRDDEKMQFLDAVRRFVEDLRAWEAAEMTGLPGFQAGLRVKRFQGRRGVWELSWAGDGRSLWTFADPVVLGKAHVIWLRVGSHQIYRDA